MPPVTTHRCRCRRAGNGRCASLCDERRSATSTLVHGLLREGTSAPINPAVSSKVRPVQVVGSTRQRLALEPFHTLVRDALSVACRSASRCSAAQRRRAIRRTKEHLRGTSSDPRRSCAGRNGRRHPCLPDEGYGEAYRGAASLRGHCSRMNPQRRADPVRRSPRRSADRRAAVRRLARSQSRPVA